jgi:hypothetical protein
MVVVAVAVAVAIASDDFMASKSGISSDYYSVSGYLMLVPLPPVWFSRD